MPTMGYSRLDFGLSYGCSEVDLRSIWGGLGFDVDVELGSTWDMFGAGLGIGPGSVLGPVGVDLGSI